MSEGISRPSRFRDLGKRAATGIVLVIVALAALYAGKTVFWVLVAFLGIAMAWEWAGLVRAGRRRAIYSAVLMAALLIFVLPEIRPIDITSLAAVGAVALIGAAGGVGLALGLLYIGLAVVAILYVREAVGLVPTLWMMSIVWATDIGAYFAGKSIGGRKLAPALSPNKTWAGLLGGTAVAAFVSAVFVLNSELPHRLILAAAVLAVAAQMGDLFESWLKRRAGVKDASNLFPGHGGALDRLDGLLPVAICVGSMVALGWFG